MTEGQKQWLKDHPNYSEVRERIVQITNWTDRGYLFPNGNFQPDDGKTLFAFKLGVGKAPLYVGREYYIS